MAVVPPERLFEHWEVSDVDLAMLRQHHGPALEQLGIAMRERDVLRLLDENLVGQPLLLISSCMCPITADRNELDRLLGIYLDQRDQRIEPSVRRIMFDVITFEAMVGQLPNASVVSVSRRTDCVRAAKCPSLLATMRIIPGYTPLACNHDVSLPPHQLVHGRDLVARTNFRGPFAIESFLDSDGSLNITALAFQATMLRWPVMLVGQWDGSMAKALALGVIGSIQQHAQEAFVVPRDPAPYAAVPRQTRILGGACGSYEEYYTYAKERRIEQVMRDRLEAIQSGRHVPDVLYSGEEVLQPTVKLNAAIMWTFATPSTLAVIQESV